MKEKQKKLTFSQRLLLNIIKEKNPSGGFKPLKNSELAEALGTSRRTITRNIDALKKANLVSFFFCPMTNDRWIKINNEK